MTIYPGDKVRMFGETELLDVLDSWNDHNIRRIELSDGRITTELSVETIVLSDTE